MQVRLEDVVFLSKIFTNYVLNVPGGKRTILGMMGIETRPVHPHHAYIPANQIDGKPLDNSKLRTFQGYLYNDLHTASVESVSIDKNGNLEGCDVTGILAPKDYCVKVVKDYSARGEFLVSMSNYARLMSENPSIRDTASKKTCETCYHKQCEYHPHKEPKQLLLTTTATGNNNVTSNSGNNFL